MSMRISRRRLAATALFGLVALLPACLSIGGGEAEAPRRVEVTSDAVIITGPRGFCIDPTATRNDGDTGFVLLGNCAAISGRARAPQPDVPAILTATISGRSDIAGLLDGLDALDGYVRSDEGRALLSRSGDADNVEILETRQIGGLFLLHARDTSAGAVIGAAQDYWRAYLNLGPRLATLTVLALAEQEVSDSLALDILTSFAAAVQAAN